MKMIKTILSFGAATKKNCNFEFNIKPLSTYVNFKLDNYQINYINSHIKLFSKNLTLVPIKLSNNIFDKKNYFISVNIYNCTSPIFYHNNAIVRCEINTYVKDKNNNYGTVILDYGSNDISLDPINLIFKQSNVTFKRKLNQVKSNVLTDTINFNLNYNLKKNFKNSLSKNLISFTDNIFYKNGMIDKLYYDNSLINAIIKKPKVNNFYFKYKDLEFKKIHSVFYFENSIDFVCSLWNNL